MSDLQHNDVDYKLILRYLESGELPVDDKLARQIVFESEQFILEHDILYHIFHPRTKRLDQVSPVVKQLCVPRVFREKLFYSYHDKNCHLGQDRLYNTLKMKYWCPKMYTSVLEYVKSCEICQKTKTSKHRKKVPLKPLEVVEPFSRIQLDFIGFLKNVRRISIFSSLLTVRHCGWRFLPLNLRQLKR